MNEVLLLGAGGLAREVAAAAADRYRVAGILDDDPTLHGHRVDGIEVLGPILDAVRSRIPVLLCIGAGPGRRAVAARLAGHGIGDDRFATLIDRSVRVPAGCTVGAGSILLAGVVLTAGVRVGRHCVLMPNVTLTHDNRLHDFVTVAAGVSFGGGVTAGEGAYIGMNASVRQHVTIGAQATVGMGAVVLRDVPDGETWAGVPAAAMLVRA